MISDMGLKDRRVVFGCNFKNCLDYLIANLLCSKYYRNATGCSFCATAAVSSHCYDFYVGIRGAAAVIWLLKHTALFFGLSQICLGAVWGCCNYFLCCTCYTYLVADFYHFAAAATILSLLKCLGLLLLNLNAVIRNFEVQGYKYTAAAVYQLLLLYTSCLAAILMHYGLFGYSFPCFVTADMVLILLNNNYNDMKIKDYLFNGRAADFYQPWRLLGCCQNHSLDCCYHLICCFNRTAASKVNCYLFSTAEFNQIIKIADHSYKEGVWLLCFYVADCYYCQLLLLYFCCLLLLMCCYYYCFCCCLDLKSSLLWLFGLVLMFGSKCKGGVWLLVCYTSAVTAVTAGVHVSCCCCCCCFCFAAAANML